jgi:hypothetical protein
MVEVFAIAIQVDNRVSGDSYAQARSVLATLNHCCNEQATLEPATERGRASVASDVDT